MSEWEIVEDEPWEVVEETASAPSPIKKPKTTVPQDILNGLLQAPGMGWDIAKALPGEAYGAAKQVVTSPLRAAKNVGAGFGELGRGLLNAPANTLDYLREKEITPEWLQAARPSSLNDVDYADSMGIEGSQAGDALLRGIPEIPFWLSGNGAKNLATKTIQRGAMFGGMGAIHNQNPVTLAATGKLLELVGKGGAKAANKGLESAIAGPSYVKNLVSGKLPAAVEELEATGKQHGINTLAGDLGPKGSTAQDLSELAEKTPIINVKPNRKVQQAQAKNATEVIADKYKTDMINESFGGPNGLAKIEKIANSAGPRSKAAAQLLEDVHNAGEDWNYILKTSGNAKLLQNKVHADKLYSKVGELSEGHGAVDLGKTLSNLDTVLNELNELPNTNKKTIGLIEGFKNDLMEKSSKPKGLNIPRQLDFNKVRKIRSTISKKISDLRSGKNELVGQEGVAHLENIKSALDADLNKFATSNGPELKNAWKEADLYYKNNVIPFKDRALVKALKAESNADEIFKMFIKNGGAEGDFGTARAAKFYKALDKKGQDAVRYGILKQASSNALDATGAFSPAKYATQLEKLAASRGVFFEGTAKAELDGLAKFMRHIERAGQIKAPDTGVKTLPAIIALGAVQTGNVASLGLSTVALKWLVTSPIGKRLLLTSASLKPGTDAFLKNVEKINSFLSSKVKPTGLSQTSQHKEEEKK